MYPIIPENSYVLTLSFNFKYSKGNILVFNHKKFGKLIKKLHKIDNKGDFWFVGNNQYSLRTEEIGPIKRDKVLGKALIIFTNKKIFLPKKT